MIRPCIPADWPALWTMMEPVFRSGRTYAFPTDITEAEARIAWIDKPTGTFVWDQEGEVLGTYYIKPNHPGPGGHVCNCGYIVAASARGRGIASMMCADSQTRAAAMGFLAMQFNLVVSTNDHAVRLWLKHGFAIAGTLPSAFRHPEVGLVDAYVMFKALEPPE